MKPINWFKRVLRKMGKTLGLIPLTEEELLETKRRIRELEEQFHEEAVRDRKPRKILGWVMLLFGFSSIAWLLLAGNPPLTPAFSNREFALMCVLCMIAGAAMIFLGDMGDPPSN